MGGGGGVVLRAGSGRRVGWLWVPPTGYGAGCGDGCGQAHQRWDLRCLVVVWGWSVASETQCGRNVAQWGSGG